MKKILPFIVLALGAVVYLVGNNEYNLGAKVYAIHCTPEERREVRERGGEHVVMESGDQKKTYGAGIFILGALWVVVSAIQGKKENVDVKKG